jgi:hypothetical protein
MKKLLKTLAILSVISILTGCYLPDWLTYTNATYGFEFKYPPSSTLVTDTPNFARIQLPITSGTNLAEKYLDVSSDPGAMPCLSPYGDPYAPPPGTLVTGTQTINGIYWVIEKASEGAMGSIYQWTAYSTMIIGETCVSLTFVLHSHQADLYPTPLPEFNLAGESLVFQLIVSSFTMTGSVPPTLVSTNTPTLVSSYTPTSVSSFTPTPVISDTPTQVASFTPTPLAYYFNPKFNSYCRLGPDLIFNSIALAMKGQSYPIDGRNRENTWLYLMINPQLGCWVPLGNGSPSADTSGVRVLADIPTPTFTPIPFCSQFKDSYSCGRYMKICNWNAQANPPACENK